MANAYEILINLAANTASLESGLKRAQDSISQFANIAKSALAFTGLTLGVSSLGDSFVKAAESGEQLVQLSQRLGTSVQSLSQLQYAASTAGVQFTSLTSGLDVFSKNIVQTVDGTGKARAAFGDLGVSATALVGIPLDKQMETVANAIAALPTATERTAAAMRLFGSAGAELLPILQQGAAGIEALRDRGDILGSTLSTLAAEDLARASRAMSDFGVASHALWTELASDAAPAITSATNALTKFAVGLQQAAGETFGFSSQQTQLADLARQAQLLAGRIDTLNARKGWFANLIDPSLLNSDVKMLTAINNQIATIKGQIDTVQKQRDAATVGPVGVTAKYIGPQTIDLRALTEVAVTAQKILTDSMQKYYDSLLTASQTDVEANAASWQSKEDAARQAYAEGLIDATEFQNRIAALNDEFLTPVEVTAKEKGKLIKTVYSDMETYAKSAAQSIQSDFATFLENPSISSFKTMGIEFLKTLEKMEADAAANTIFANLFGTPGTSGALGSGGLGSILGGLLGSLFGGGSGSDVLEEVASPGLLSLDGFANGGSFDVGGSGGTDSQLAAFWATPGEHVQVGGGGASSPVVIQNYVTVTSPQVTKSDVLSAMVQTQNSTVAKLQDMKRRGSF